MPLARAELGDDPLMQWPQLSTLLPDRPITSSTLQPGEGDQQRLFWAVTRLLEVLTGVTPLVLALDDLHWADQSSLSLLQHLVRHLRQAPVLLVGTYRNTDVEHRQGLGPVLRDLHREHLVDEIVVGRLDRQETAGFITSLLRGEEVAPAFVAHMHDHTEGSAFFVQEVVRGRLLTGQGEWPEAERDLDKAVRMAQEMLYRNLEARGQFEWGAMHRDKGEPGEARAKLEEALLTFRQPGARPFIDRTERELVQL